jgi:crotonobetainyl-CoA:carnitine CoA-transferase CaiB-like acyl-CoA transferase
MTDLTATALTGLRVVEIAGSPAGGFAAKLLADRGAHVTRLVPTEGPPASLHDTASGSPTGLELLLDDLKVAAPLDPEHLTATLSEVDVVLESSAPGPLDPVVHGLDLERVAPRLVAVAISPFGRCRVTSS